MFFKCMQTVKRLEIGLYEEKKRNYFEYPFFHTKYKYFTIEVNLN